MRISSTLPQGYVNTLVGWGGVIGRKAFLVGGVVIRRRLTFASLVFFFLLHSLFYLAECTSSTIDTYLRTKGGEKISCVDLPTVLSVSPIPAVALAAKKISKSIHLDGEVQKYSDDTHKPCFIKC